MHSIKFFLDSFAFYMAHKIAWFFLLSIKW